MGYACPVCSEPQADGEHLANHLAFSALLGHDDPAEWLDEHAPGWGDDDPDDLAERVAPHCDSVEYQTVFDDTTGERPDVDVQTPGHGPSGPPRAPGPNQLDREAREILEEARRMTERRRGQDEGDGEVDAGADEGDGEAEVDERDADGSE
jgi:hypothetical protein